MPATSFKTLVRAVVAFACLVGLTAFAPAAGAEVSSSGGGGATFTPPPPPPEKAKLVFHSAEGTIPDAVPADLTGPAAG